MISDTLTNASNYYDRHSCFKEAFDFLQNNDLANMPLGKHAINGDKVFCILSEGDAVSKEQAKLEAHRRYIDIQYIISGKEEMGWLPIEQCDSVDAPYSEENDIIFFTNSPESWTMVESGSFAVFFPEDGHAPMAGKGKIHKAVIKVLVE